MRTLEHDDGLGQEVRRRDARRDDGQRPAHHPTAAWAAQQIVHALPNETTPAYLLRDRDAIYEADFKRRVEHMGIHQLVIPPRAPWQKSFRRARHRLDPARMPRSCHRTQQAPPAALASLIPLVLQRRAASPESRQRQHTPASGPAGLIRAHRHHRRSRHASSPLFARRLNVCGSRLPSTLASSVPRSDMRRYRHWAYRRCRRALLTSA